mgnify:CR=1 FL=1|tara:strand:- start:51848 stop:52342 length:495 start_codon:yes stop_codon:yes gene_type:complete
MRLASLLLCACLVLPLATPVQAHREQSILTSIAFNPRTHMLEVIHQLYAHDVEHAFGNAIQSEGGLDNIRAQALVSLELAKSFRLWNAQREEISLILVGAELEAEFFYIYQEAEITAIPDVMQIEHGMLRNYWADMQNYLNVNYEGSVSSLIFSGNDGIKSISK